MLGLHPNEGSRELSDAVETLLREIAERPDDDDLRRVLADQYLERGDPRGELITLQLAGSDPVRQRKLLQKHAAEWLGVLAPLTRTPEDWRFYRFERGFPSAIAIVFTDELQNALDRCVGDRVWATVRHLDLGILDDLPVPIVRHPVMRSLVHLGGLRRAVLEQVLAEPLRVRSLGVRPEDLDLIEPHRAELRALELSGWQQSPDVLRRWSGWPLEHLGFEWSLRALPSWHRELGHAPPTLQTVAFAVERLWLQRVELSRDGRGRFSIATVHAPSGDVHQTTEVLCDVLPRISHGAIKSVTFVDGIPTTRLLRKLEEVTEPAGISIAVPKRTKRRAS